MKQFLVFVSALILGLSCTNTIEKADIPVASVSISRSSAELVEGESLTLTASVSPSDATEKTVSWSSSKPSVASVDQKGTVNALSVGTAVIKASAGGKNDSCTITVISKTIEVSSIALDKSSLSLKIGEEYQLNATINPSNASEKNVNWSSASSSIATVKNGLVKGISAGETEITASCGGKKAICKVKITPVEVESISLSKSELDLFVGDSKTITATIKPENASDQQITWSSSDSRIATVSKGSITGVKEGIVVITAKAGSKTADCKVTVKKTGVPVSSITLNKTTVFMISGGKEVLTATVKPSNATEKDVNWSSSNSSVVSVSDGILSAKSIGRVTITATAGGVSTSCEVEVVNENDSRVDYFCIDVLAGGNLHIYYPRQGVFEYSMDLGKNWTAFDFLKTRPFHGDDDYYYVKLTCTSGDRIMLRGTWKYQKRDNEDFKSYEVFAESTITANISGHLLSIIKQDSFWDSDTDQYVFEDGGWYQETRNPIGYSFFSGFRIVSAKNLILPTKTPYFYGMFKDCTYLQDAPSLPSTDLSKGSYEKMFSGCTYLKEAPQLPATTLSEFCYAEMFTNCKSIEEAPKLPATSLPQGCYNGMFKGCTRLKQAPALPAKQMNYREYNYSYTTGGCYSNMFEGCTSLETAPELPATILAEDCYAGMFSGCTKLTTAPTLPATTMASNCYSSMFSGCTSLISAPSLPATALASNCYFSMFSGCTSLTSAPSLPALYLVSGCYSYIFEGCSKINYVKALFVIAETNSLRQWLEGTAKYKTGTFIKNKDAYWTTAAEANIPFGWKLIDSE